MLRRTLAAGLALCLVACADPALALPRPRGDQWWLSAMGVQEAWKRTTGRGVTVALVDTEPNLSLPEFAGGDLHKGPHPGKADPYEIEEGKESHGTSMLGLIAAQGGGSGYVGVAPDAKAIAISSDNTANLSDTLKAAIDQGADVVNISGGYAALVLNTPDADCNPEMIEVAAYAEKHDAVLVAAAGNNEAGGNVPTDPAMCPGYVAVGGLSRRLTPRKQPLHHDYITVAAPSEDLTLLYNSGVLAKRDGGTSSATALTTGAVALLRAAHPEEKARQIVSRLLYSAQDVHTPGRDDYTGYGLIRPDKAMTVTVPPDFVNPVYQRLDAWMKDQADWRAQRDNPPEFAVGGDPDRHRAAPASDWETYGPWVLAAVACGVAVGLLVFFVLRRKRRARAPH